MLKYTYGTRYGTCAAGTRENGTRYLPEPVQIQDIIGVGLFVS